MAEWNLRQGKAIAVGFAVGAVAFTSLLSLILFLVLSGVGLALAALYPFVRDIRRGLDASAAIYFFVIYFIFAMGVRGVAVFTYQDSPYLVGLQDPDSLRFQSLLGWVFFYSALGLLALYAGYYSGAAVRLGERMVRALDPGRLWKRSRIVPVALVWMAIGLAGAMAYVQAFGGFRAVTGNLVFVATEGSLGHFWQIALMEFAVVGLHLLVVGNLTEPGGRLRWLPAVSGVTLVLFLYLITSSKFLILRAFVPLAIFYHLLRRRIHFAHMVLLLVAFGLLFPVFYAYRQFGLADMHALSDQVQDTQGEAWLLQANVLTRAYDADSFLMVLDRTGNTVPFRFGASLLDLTYFFIPRSLWPEKPMSYSLQFADHYYSDVRLGGLNFVSPSLMGELYANFHVLGIVVGMWLLGLVMRASHGMAIRGGGPGALLYGYIFLTAIHMVEGSIAAQIEFALMGVVPAWLGMWALRRSTGSLVAVAVPGVASRVPGAMEGVAR